MLERKTSALFCVKVADINIKSAKADIFPSLALTAGYLAADIPAS
jgi:outer membrane protein TolC